MKTESMNNPVPPEAPDAEWVEANKCRFYTRRWTAPNPVARVVFVHGFVEHIDRYDWAFKRLASRGISVFAYDQRGFGRTAWATSTQGITSWSKALPDIDHFIAQELARDQSTPLYLYGHSMGGAEVLAYATRTPPTSHVGQLAGVISSAPLLRQADAVRANPALIAVGGMLGKLLPSLQINVGVASNDISRDPEVNAAYAKDPLCAPIGTYNGVAAMIQGGSKLLQNDYRQWPSKLPLLLYFGDDDRVVSFEAGKQFVDRLKADDKTFIPYAGGFHELHNDPCKEEVMDNAADWILKRADKRSSHL